MQAAGSVYMYYSPPRSLAPQVRLPAPARRAAHLLAGPGEPARPASCAPPLLPVLGLRNSRLYYSSKQASKVSHPWPIRPCTCGVAPLARRAQLPAGNRGPPIHSQPSEARDPASSLTSPQARTHPTGAPLHPLCRCSSGRGSPSTPRPPMITRPPPRRGPPTRAPPPARRLCGGRRCPGPGTPTEQRFGEAQAVVGAVPRWRSLCGRGDFTGASPHSPPAPVLCRTALRCRGGSAAHLLPCSAHLALPFSLALLSCCFCSTTCREFI